MDVLPFALETQPTCRPISENRAYGRSVIACCGCGQRLGKGLYYWLDLQSLTSPRQARVTLTTGYRRNGHGVFLRKRRPRRSVELPRIFEDEADDLNGIRVCIGEAIQQNAPIVCHRCGRRQIVRVR